MDCDVPCSSAVLLGRPLGSRHWKCREKQLQIYHLRHIKHFKRIITKSKQNNKFSRSHVPKIKHEYVYFITHFHAD